MGQNRDLSLPAEEQEYSQASPTMGDMGLGHVCLASQCHLLGQVPLSLCLGRSWAAELSELPASPCSPFYSCSKNERCWIVLFFLPLVIPSLLNVWDNSCLPSLPAKESLLWEILFWLSSNFLKQAACKLTPSPFPKTWKLLTRYCSASHLIHTCYQRTKYSLESPSHQFVFPQNFLKRKWVPEEKAIQLSCNVWDFFLFVLIMHCHGKMNRPNDIQASKMQNQPHISSQLCQFCFQ